MPLPYVADMCDMDGFETVHYEAHFERHVLLVNIYFRAIIKIFIARCL